MKGTWEGRGFVSFSHNVSDFLDKQEEGPVGLMGKWPQGGEV